MGQLSQYLKYQAQIYQFNIGLLLYLHPTFVCYIIENSRLQNMDSTTHFEIIEKVNQQKKISVKEVYSHPTELMTAKFGYEDQLVAAGYSDGKVKIFNVNTNKKLHELNPGLKQKQNAPINSLKWRPVNQNSETMGSVLLVTNTNGQIYQYVGKNGKQIFHTSENGNYILTVDYKKDGSAFATGGKDNVIRLYDQETKKILTELKSVQWNKVGHNNRIFCVKFSKEDSNLMFSGGWDQNVYGWDLRTGEVCKRMNGPKIAGEAIDIQGDTILTGANRNSDQLQLWSFKEEKTILTFKWDGTTQQTGSALFSCQFCPSDPNLIIAAGGNQMKLFSMQNHNQLIELQVSSEDNLYTCDSSPTNFKFLAGGKRGNLFYLQGKQY